MVGTAFLVTTFVTAAEVVPTARVRNDTLRLPGRTPVAGYGLVNAFPGVVFQRPVALAAPPEETNRLFIVERSGCIYVITNLTQPDKTLFLDLSQQVVEGGGEGGLLGLAFHPGFESNRQFFVFLTRYQSTPGAANRLHDVVCRFEASATNPNQARVESETMFLAQADDSDEHNSGDLKFGPDGYLYVSIGERVNRDVFWADQTPVDRDLQGAILRIDVDRRPENLLPNPHPASTLQYSIPADNPFVALTNHHGLTVIPSEVRTELFAIGFRNPWRMAFDPVTGDLYVADVGGNREEEIDLVVPGGDYGWPYFEGRLSQGYAPLPSFNPLPPLHTYPHGWGGGTNGSCIIGGVVYRGGAMPWLAGRYLFSDFYSGNVWALQRETTGVTVERLTGSSIGPSAFGIDPRDREVLMTHFYDGTVLRLVYASPAEVTNLPASLAETGIFADLTTLAPAPGVIPYTINVPFWSDHAAKTRWFCLPETDMKIGFDPVGSWNFPTGAVWVKHFEMTMTNGQPASVRRLETRVLVNASDGFYGLTYRWDESATNAWLVPEEGADEPLTIRDADGTVLREQIWHFPSRADCRNCHTRWGGRVLGFNTAQLNRSVTTDAGMENQLTVLGAMDYLDPKPPDEELPALAQADDPTAPLEFRVRSYLQANCSACHVPGAHGWFSWDARLSTPMAQTGILSPGGVIVPGSLQESRLYHRLYGFPQLMPPIATSIYNSNAMELVANWITNLPPAPWSYETIGDTLHPGGSILSNGVFRVGGTGLGLYDSTDAFHFTHLSMDASAAHFIVRLVSQDAPTGQAFAGLMAREGTGASDRFLLAGSQPDGSAWLLQRTEPGTPAIAEAMGAASLPQWWRLVRRGNALQASRSEDGTNWIALGSGNWDVGGPLQIGLAVSSDSRTAFNQAVFDSVSTLSLVLTSATPTLIQQPAPITLSASVQSEGRSVTQVEFYHGQEKIGESTMAPHGIVVSNLWTGDHEFTASAVDDAGNYVVSLPLSFRVLPRPTVAASPIESRHFGGNWREHYGTDGWLIVGDSTNLPPFVEVSLTGGTLQTWEPETGDPRALAREGTLNGIAAAWTATNSFIVSVHARDGALRRLTLYFLDWDTENERIQQVEFIDPASGAVVLSQVLSNFSEGVYLTLLARGDIDLRLTPLAVPGAVLNGLFLDPAQNNPPLIELLSPADGLTVELPTNLVVQTEVSDAGSGIDRVEYYLDGSLAGTIHEPPFDWLLARPIEGPHVLMARAYDGFGDHADAIPVQFEAVLPRPKAVFLEEDVATRGKWPGRYGAEGVLMPPLVNLWPSELPLGIEGATTWLQAEGDDESYLFWPGQQVGVFSFYYSYGTIRCDLDLADGHPRTLAAYFFDESLYSQSVSIVDPATGKVLDARSVINGLGGRYLVWNLQGRLSLQVTNPAPNAQARLNGLFLGPFTNEPPAVVLTEPAAPMEVATPARILLGATAETAAGVRRIEFHTLKDRLGESLAPPYQFLWEFPTAGSYQVFARAITTSGSVADSPAVNVLVRFEAPSKARFVRMDTTTRGTWQPGYGTGGYLLPSSFNYVNLPSAINITNPQQWEDYGYTDQSAALVRPGQSMRILSFWSGSESWSFRLRIEDGKPRRVSLYTYAPGWTNDLTFTVFSADGKSALDSRTIASQDAGTYLTWDIQGEVAIQLAAPGAYAFLNGVFIDATPAPYLDWQRGRFTLADQANPAISSEAADPDGDGYDNWAEFLLGRDPAARTEPSPLWLKRESGVTQLHVLLAKTTGDTMVGVESSPNLQDWSESTGLNLMTVLDRGDQMEQVYQVDPDQDGQPRFFRLQFRPSW